jgi:hypothetical protein
MWYHHLKGRPTEDSLMTQQTLTQQQPLTIQLRPTTQEKLRDRAAKAGMSLEMLVVGLVEREAEVDDSLEAIAKAVACIRGRTHEQMLIDRQRILGLTPDPRPIPQGKTLFDVVEGTWPGDESDEQIRESLEKLS